MPLKKATEIKLSENGKRIITEFAKSKHQPLHLKIRAGIILRAAEGKSNRTIVKEMSLEPKTVRRWRGRFANYQDQLSQIEEKSPHKLRSAIIGALSDKPRRGGVPKFTTDEVTAIIKISCVSPEEYGFPVSHWTPGLLQRKVIELGIVDSISVRQVGRFLKGEGSEASSIPDVAKP